MKNYNKHIRKVDKILLELVKIAPDKKLYIGCLTKIGNKFGVSREWVRQIARKSGYIMPWTMAKIKRFAICRGCGKTFYRKVHQEQQKFHSLSCKKEYYHKVTNCKMCGKKLIYFRSEKKPNVCKTCRPAYVSKILSKSPDTTEELLKDWPTLFTVKEFRQKYSYKSSSGGYFRLQRLSQLGLVKRLKVGYEGGFSKKSDLYLIREKGK